MMNILNCPSLPRGTRPYVMGILNLTPDSFSDGGQYNTPAAALAQAKALAEAGADILDLGAQSTRPGAKALSAEEELARLSPILPLLAREIPLPLSVDTFHPQAAQYALAHGVHIVNDVSGALNPQMARVVRENGAGWIVMHNGGGAHALPDYPQGVLAAVRGFFADALRFAEAEGIPAEQLCFDPGFGFGKSAAENHSLLQNFSDLRVGDIPLLAALSRKRFLTAAENPAEVTLAMQDAATQKANAAAVQGGAELLRVHRVETTNNLQGR